MNFYDYVNSIVRVKIRGIELNEEQLKELKRILINMNLNKKKK